MKTNLFGGTYLTARKTIDNYLKEGKEMPPWSNIHHLIPKMLNIALTATLPAKEHVRYPWFVIR